MSGLRRLLLAAVGGVLVLGGLAFASPGLAATGGGACQLNGVALFSPNGPGATSSFGYSFSGNLSNCQSNISGAPTSGTLSVGQVLTESVPITTSTGAVVQGTARYQMPLATGSGNIPVNSCAAGSTSGTGLIGWPNGTNTVANYTTQSVGAAVNLQGTVIPNMTLTLVPGSANPAGTAPSTFTISSTNPTFPVGDSTQGLLTFTTSNPDQCTTSQGLTSADVQGTVAVGSAS
jgi:hypothetical protein